MTPMAIKGSPDVVTLCRLSSHLHSLDNDPYLLAGLEGVEKHISYLKAILQAVPQIDNAYHILWQM
jgi:hypothetical protein